MSQQFLTERTNIIQVGGAAVTLGQKTAANSLPVTVASDQSALTVSGTVTAASQTGSPTTTTPTVADSTSVTILSANSSRKYLFVQNNSSANIMISLSAATLTGITPTSSNKGVVLPPGASYENPAHYCSTAAITAYQTSGSSINTVVVIEG